MHLRSGNKHQILAKDLNQTSCLEKGEKEFCEEHRQDYRMVIDFSMPLAPTHPLLDTVLGVLFLPWSAAFRSPQQRRKRWLFNTQTGVTW